MTTAAREARRVRAEADAICALSQPGNYTTSAGIATRAGVESATRVQITDVIVQAYRPGCVPGSVVWHRVRGRLVRAFEAAGFEVTT